MRATQRFQSLKLIFLQLGKTHEGSHDTYLLCIIGDPFPRSIPAIAWLADWAEATLARRQSPSGRPGVLRDALSRHPVPVGEGRGYDASWGNDGETRELRGKRKSTRLRKGAPWLKTMFVQCAWAAKRANASGSKAQFFRLQARRGLQKAICTVAASILTAIYHRLKDGTFHQDLGVADFDRRSPEAKVKRLARELAKLGFEITLQPSAKAA